MKNMDKPSHALGTRLQAASDLESHFLQPLEIRLIADGKLDKLADFASSARLHTPDPKGDTALHIAARIGNLAVCDLFIRSGADPTKLNHERQTPADVALAEGQVIAARLLGSLVSQSQTFEKITESQNTSKIETKTSYKNIASEDPISDPSREGSVETTERVNGVFEERHWTEPRQKELLRLWSMGVEPGKIAKNLGGLFTTGGILNEIHRLGIYNRKGITDANPDRARDKVISESATLPAWPDERIDVLKTLWAAGRSASQIATEMGGVTRNAVLSKVHRLGLSDQRQTKTGSLDKVQNGHATTFAAPPYEYQVQWLTSESSGVAVSSDQVDTLDKLLLFEAEKEPGDFFDQHKGNPASGTLLASVITSSAISGVADGSWDLDLSPAVIAGEGMGAGTAVVANHGADTDFLQVRNGGRQSLKRAVAQTGTRISITSELCITWAEEILAKGRCSLIDIDLIVAHCEGNSDIEELRINLQCNLEAAGFVIDPPTGHVDEFWNTMPDISSDDLAEAIQATLSRRTRLPGTGRFVMDKSDELQLLEPMVRARQELQLGILRSEAAVAAILDTIDDVMAGHRPPGNVSLRAIIPARLGHAETSDFMAAADSLKSWQTNGRVMSGKQRREALNALENLDLSLAYHKELICKLRCVPSCLDDAAGLDALISTFEDVTERLVIAHLPYARRFAARNVEEFEDPEDVFQVAFMGLHRSTRRFDPERGFRFLIYATYGMRQAIARWRADEGSAIRIPVHRGEKIVKFDYALSKLDVRANGNVLDDELAGELEWTIDEVRQFRAFPREAEYPDSVDDWEKLLPEQEVTNVFDQDEVEMILKNAIDDLPERQADIIRMRFGIGRDAEMTLEEIGQLYGVTRERIRQIEAKGLHRLSHPGRKRRLHYLLGMQ